MNKDVVTAIVQLLISLGGAGLFVQLLLLRQNRRKIAGDASMGEANAASTLSGAAMKMVENAQSKEREAEARSEVLEVKIDKERKAYEARRDVDSATIEELRWDKHGLQMRVAILEGALRSMGVEPPETGLPQRPVREIEQRPEDEIPT